MAVAPEKAADILYLPSTGLVYPTVPNPYLSVSPPKLPNAP